MRPIRFIIIAIVLVLAAYGLHLLVYGSTLTLEHVSNSLFVVGIIVFFPSLIVQTGSYELFYGIRYSFNVFIVKNYRRRYPTLASYKEEKEQVIRTTFFKELLIASLIICIVAWYLGTKVTYGV